MALPTVAVIVAPRVAAEAADALVATALLAAGLDNALRQSPKVAKGLEDEEEACFNFERWLRVCLSSGGRTLRKRAGRHAGKRLKAPRETVRVI